MKHRPVSKIVTRSYFLNLDSIVLRLFRLYEMRNSVVVTLLQLMGDSSIDLGCSSTRLASLSDLSLTDGVLKVKKYAHHQAFSSS